MSSRPDRQLVFDGHCHLCSGWVQFMQQHPIDPPYQLIPMQSEAGRALLIAHGIDADDPTTFLVIDGERARTASDAVIHLVASQGGLWRAVAIGRLLPRTWRDGLYRLLARNRYRWFGRRATCYLPRPEGADCDSST